ncbi:MAG: BBE domain-containing protein, partial [Rhodococcus sp. (in: high G+C Gram-positive bacteria)]
RNMYRDIYADTGGVPVPNDANAGAYINYPDSDLKDPAWNTSGVPWSTLYYGDHYSRLQEIKATWDPGNLFRHDLSIELPRT